ncbi:MAG: glycosyltransferase family 4 protein [Pseudomonadota bacterium]
MAIVRILCVATKPPWPPRDGGRLALWLTLQGLAEAGHDIMLIAPSDTDAETQAEQATMLASVCSPHLVPVAKRSWLGALAAALIHRQALTAVRHHLSEIEQAVVECVTSWQPDVLHVEQLQAFSNCKAAHQANIPIVLRMQNVESSLWQQVGLARLYSRLFLLEARRLRAEEMRAMHTVMQVVALTERDAEGLRSIAGSAAQNKVIALAPPFPSHLPAGEAVSGTPAVVLAGSVGWWPNTEGIKWFLDQVAPKLASADSRTRIHVYGGVVMPQSVHDGCVIWHPAPADAIEAFPAGAIAAIPLHIGSGIRMRILEAWARGLPVVATATAVAGLQVESGRELLIADTPAQFVQAILRLSRDPTLCTALIDTGRAYLVKHHDSVLQTGKLIAQFDAARRECKQ